jgi:cyclopropane fatty-acyl-phospholipid synthase-like methyltransferase
MRLGHSYVEVGDARAAQTMLPTGREQLATHMSYEREMFASREAFLAAANERWIAELRDVLRELLEPARAVLSVGSGRGEHEVPLHLEGYDIVASELVDGALDDARRLFPGFHAIGFDVLAPSLDSTYDDLLATGIDYVLDDEGLQTLFATGRRITRLGGRVILVHRYRDSLATRIIDGIGLPAWALARNVFHGLRRDGVRIVRRQHGWRRTRAEIRALAEAGGFRTGRIRHAAFGMELARLPVPAPLLRAVARADRRLHVLSSATVFEFLRAA